MRLDRRTSSFFSPDVANRVKASIYLLFVNKYVNKRVQNTLVVVLVLVYILSGKFGFISRYQK